MTARLSSFALLAAVAAAQTVPLTVVNAGFEAPPIPAGTFNVASAPPGWSAYGPINNNNRSVGVLHPATTTLYPAAVEGANVGVVFLMDNPGNQLFFSGTEAGLQQTLAATLQTGRRHVLRVEIGNIANDVNAPFLFGGFPGYRVELAAGGVPLAADVNGLLPAEGGFLTSTVVLETGATHPQAGLPLRIRLVNLNAAPGIEVNFDHVRLDATPIATWTPLGFGLAGAAGEPLLQGVGDLLPFTVNQLLLSNAAPFASCALALGAFPEPTPLLGGTLYPAPELVLFFATDGAGAFALPFALSAPLPSGATLFAQFWVADAGGPFGFAASGALRLVAP